MRRHGVRGKTVNLKIRYSNFRTITRAQTLPVPTQSTRELEEVVDQVFARVELEGRSVRLLGMGVSNLSRREKTQGLLFDNEDREKTNRLDTIKDQIKDRFGHAAVRRATSMEHEIGHRPDPRVNDE